MNKNAKIYVAGHGGLVGSAIWKALLNEGYKNLIGRSRQELDLEQEVPVAAFFEKEKPEYVFLAAARVGGIEANNKYRADFIYKNLQIQQNVIGQSYRHSVRKLLFLGSTCIYPKDAPQPIKEDYLLTGPLEYTNEPYAIAKIAGLKLCESFNLQYGTNYLAVMPTNLYGPNDNFDLGKGHVLPALMRKFYLAKCLEEENWEAVRRDLNARPIELLNGAASDKEIGTALKKFGISREVVEIWGSGKPKREFLWSEDMADACLFLMKNIDFQDMYDNQRAGEKQNFHINIGSGTEISISDLAQEIKNIVNYLGDITFNTGRPDGTLRKLTDVSKLHSLGWTNRVALQDGIKRLLEWYKGSQYR